MDRARFVSVLLAVSPSSVKLLKNGAAGIAAASDAKPDEIAQVERWIGYKTGQPVAASPKPAKPAAKSTAAKGAASVTAKDGQPLPFATAAAVHIPSADVPGKLESQVALRNALVTAGYPAVAADALAASLPPVEIAGLLLARKPVKK